MYGEREWGGGGKKGVYRNQKYHHMRPETFIGPNALHQTNTQNEIKSFIEFLRPKRLFLHLTLSRSLSLFHSTGINRLTEFLLDFIEWRTGTST